MPDKLHIPEIAEDDDTLSAAIKYAKAGLYLLPVKRGEKHPGSIVGKGWQTQSSKDINQIAAWFAGTDHNIAIHCGRSGLVVFDIDHPEHTAEIFEHLNTAPYQATRDMRTDPARGHYLFAQPAGRNLGNSNGNLGRDWGEIRGHNGVIIASPSQHPDPDGQYRWIRTGLVPTLPDELADKLPDAEPADTAATDEQIATFIEQHTDSDDTGLLNGWIKAFANHCERGSRHNGMVSVLAGALKEAAAGYFPAQVAVDTLRKLFIEAATRAPTGGERQRTAAEASREFAGILSWAAAQANSADVDKVKERTFTKMSQPIGNGASPSNVIPITTAATAQAVVVNGPYVTYGYTETAAAAVLVEECRNRIRYCPQLKRWLEWTGTRWEIQPDRTPATTAIRQVALDINPGPADKAEMSLQRRLLTNAGSKAVIELAQHDRLFQVERDALDANGYELNTPSGIVDLRSGAVTAHQQESWHTKITGCEIDTGAAVSAPKWMQFLDDTFGGDAELSRYMQQLFGYAAIGEVTHQIMPFMFGAGANGKSVMLEVVRRVLGDYATVTPGKFLVVGGKDHEADMAKLVGARLVTCSEVNEDSKFDEQRVKDLTGGEKLNGRYLYGQAFDFTPSHTLFLAGNHQPAVSAGGVSMWRRLRLIPFNHVVPESKRNEHLSNELFDEEGPAILAWIVAGAQHVSAHGFDEPASVSAATQEYAEDEDTIRLFVEERLIVGDGAVQTNSSLIYDDYVSWVSGIPKSRQVFGRELSIRLGPAHRPRRTMEARFVPGVTLRFPRGGYRSGGMF